MKQEWFLFHQAWARDLKNIPKRRLFPTTLLHARTQKSYNINFFVTKVLDYV